MPRVYTNRRAHFEYELIERFEAGIVLQGTEIKSIRANSIDFRDAYALFRGNELWLENLYIPPYDKGSYNNHEPRRSRKLLLHRRELSELRMNVSKKGLTVVPVKLYFKGRLAKLEIALARGKKLHDKRAAAAEREAKREMERYR